MQMYQLAEHKTQEVKLDRLKGRDKEGHPINTLPQYFMQVKQKT